MNEGVFQYGDLCPECYQRKSGPSPQLRTNPVVVPTTSAASAANVSGTQPPVSTLSSSATIASAHHLPSASPRAAGYRYCSNPTCLNEIVEQGRFVCSRCESWLASLPHVIPPASLQLLGRMWEPQEVQQPQVCHWPNRHLPILVLLHFPHKLHRRRKEPPIRLLQLLESLTHPHNPKVINVSMDVKSH